ncbi:MAG: hypothetical protein HeimC3_26500 [Candidatus Heimdallarchaeota archaeon LC_3]|nr:MAG: hypothetical protein HeimC3_26500 [Candidatus Heimdallarchaeota archaeon LC_3]
MTYEGVVGDISNNDTWENLKFLFGLLVYNLERPDEGVRYQVINYYVINASVHEDPFYEFLDIFTDLSNFIAWNPELSLAAVGAIVLSTTFLLIRRRKKLGRRRKK